jgi:hypothetical protein
LFLFRGSWKEHDVRSSPPLAVRYNNKLSIDIFSWFTTNIKKERDPIGGGSRQKACEENGEIMESG